MRATRAPSARPALLALLYALAAAPTRALDNGLAAKPGRAFNAHNLAASCTQP
jgi:hypothetical protein